MTESGNPILPNEVFAIRLANLLVGARVRQGRSVGSMARASNGAFSRHDLRAYEAGERTVPDGVAEQLALLYSCDLASILPTRTPVVIAPGKLSVGGVEVEYAPADSTALLTAYLTLVRSLRRMNSAPEVPLRRDDIEALASAIGEDDSTVLERLAGLMSATKTKRLAMAGLLATGAAVIGLVGTAAAVGTLGSGTSTTTTSVSGTSTTVVVASSTTGAPDSSTTLGTATTLPSPETSVVVTTTVAPIVTPTVAPPVTPAPTVAPPTTQPASIGSDVPLPTTTTTIVSDGGTPPLPTPPHTTIPVP